MATCGFHVLINCHHRCSVRLSPPIIFTYSCHRAIAKSRLCWWWTYCPWFNYFILVSIEGHKHIHICTSLRSLSPFSFLFSHRCHRCCSCLCWLSTHCVEAFLLPSRKLSAQNDWRKNSREKSEFHRMIKIDGDEYVKDGIFDLQMMMMIMNTIHLH